MQTTATLATTTQRIRRGAIAMVQVTRFWISRILGRFHGLHRLHAGGVGHFPSAARRCQSSRNRMKLGRLTCDPHPTISRCAGEEPNCAS